MGKKDREMSLQVHTRSSRTSAFLFPRCGLSFCLKPFDSLAERDGTVAVLWLFEPQWWPSVHVLKDIVICVPTHVFLVSHTWDMVLLLYGGSLQSSLSLLLLCELRLLHRSPWATLGSVPNACCTSRDSLLRIHCAQSMERQPNRRNGMSFFL